MSRQQWLLSGMLGLSLFMPTTILADYRFLDKVQSFRQERNQVILECGGPVVRIVVLAPDLFRIRLAPRGLFPEDHSYSVIKKEWSDVKFSVHEEEENIIVATEELLLKISKSPCRLAFYNPDGHLINRDYDGMGMGWDGNRIVCCKEMPPYEKYFGLGEKVGGVDKRGRSWVMWNTDFPGYTNRTDPLYQSHPFFLALNEGEGYGIFFDNTYRSEFQFGVGTDAFYSFGADDGELNYYFFYGPGLKEILMRYTELVGRMSLPPKWALGYQQCRYSYYPESEVYRIARTFREKEIPCDVLYLDIHYMDGFRCFTWDKKCFPDPKRLMDDLEKWGFKVVVIIDPGIKMESGYWVHDEGVKGDHFCRLPDGNLYVGRVWPGACYFPDFTRPETREWWGGLYKGLLDVGVDGFWNDMNEPGVWGGTFPGTVQHHDFGQMVDHSKIHNVYGMQMARGTFEGNLRLHSQVRPFVLTRAGFSGIQRYAAVWTGDNLATWEHLSMSIPMCLGLGLSGVPFVGYDIGGFGGNPSPDLFTRWLQLGVFTPLCRNHTAWGTNDQEPWVFGDRHEAINKRIIQLRYELMPYIYDAFRKASLTGIPIMRPMVLEYQEDENTHLMDDQFFFGEDLLVAPILKEDATLRKVYLPEGEWYGFNDNEKYIGHRFITVDAPLDRIPVFIRAGAIVPLQEAVNYLEEKPINPLILNIYPSHIAATDSLYEDDGNGFAYQEGHFCYTLFRVEVRGDEIIARIGVRRGKFEPPKRCYLLKFHGIQKKPHSVRLQGGVLESASNKEDLVQELRGWWFDGESDSVWIVCADTGKETIVRIQ